MLVSSLQTIFKSSQESLVCCFYCWLHEYGSKIALIVVIACFAAAMGGLAYVVVRKQEDDEFHARVSFKNRLRESNLKRFSLFVLYRFYACLSFTASRPRSPSLLKWKRCIPLTTWSTLQ